MSVATDTNEFSFLPDQARSLGVDVPPVERLTLALPDGRELSALRYGLDSPAVTLLHGAGLNAHTWDTTALILQQPVLAIDLAGHGDSSWRDDMDYSPRTLAADIALALQAWTDRPQILVGHSLGGLTAAALTAAHPELVQNIVIVDITPGIDTSGAPTVLRDFYAGPTDFASRDDLVDRAIAFGFGGARSDTARGVFFNTRIRADGRVEWKHHFAHLAAQTLAVHAPGTAEAPSSRSAEGWSDLTTTQTPVTLVRAISGFVTEADAVQFHRRVPRARVVAVEASHNVQETAPGELAALVSNALSAQPETSAASSS